MPLPFAIPPKVQAKDGEGATKLIECTVSEAENLDTAITVAKSVIHSSLFKPLPFPLKYRLSLQS